MGVMKGPVKSLLYGGCSWRVTDVELGVLGRCKRLGSLLQADPSHLVGMAIMWCAVFKSS